jgi:cell division protein FtsW
MGFIIAISLVALYLGIMWQGIQVAKAAPDYFGKIVAAGIVTWITFQAVVNIMAMLSLLPLTGIPLPFVSYGSTSMATLLASVGILINISRQTNQAH